MKPIKTLYLTNHTHTDIGYTDFQDVVFRQHNEYIDLAMDLIEATLHLPSTEQFRWTCEVTGITERYLDSASPENVERFQRLHASGHLDVAGLQYHHTPLQNVEQMIRSLYPVCRMREKYGITATSAMQCDVNGISWIYADLMPEAGVDFLTMAINPVRGYTPQPRPAGFWWESPSGKKMLAWNGFHYSWGFSIAMLGDWNLAEETLGKIIGSLEADPDYPFDFLYGQCTHPAMIDNGPPEPSLVDFVQEWNARGLSPQIEFTTVTAFGRFLRETHGDELPTWRGDWLDWWSDGVGSSSFETGLNRATHEHLQMAESIGSWLEMGGDSGWNAERARDAYENATLYDEHTWGSYSSVAVPDTVWVKSQWNRKASYGYIASSESLDMLTRAGRGLAKRVGAERDNSSELLVINTLPWPRRVTVDEPEKRPSQAAPLGLPDSLFPRASHWNRRAAAQPINSITVDLPGFGFVFAPNDLVPSEDDLRTDANTIENDRYRVRINPQTGALDEWYDKRLNHDFAGKYRGWGVGEYIYERVESPEVRDALYFADFEQEYFGYGRTDTPFRHATATSVQVGEPTITRGRASITVTIAAEGINGGTCSYWLQSGESTLGIDWSIDKVAQTDVEAVFFALPFNLGTPSFRADVNGVPFTPEQDQLNGTVRDWYPLGRWVDVSDGERGVTIVPLDAPLAHIGGITTGKWARTLEPEGPTVMSWALNNHWFTNFAASQQGVIPFRYRLTTHAGPVDDQAAARFGAEQATPPVVFRGYAHGAETQGSYVEVPESSQVLVTMKPAEDGEGVILRVQSIAESIQSVRIGFPSGAPYAAHLCSSLEETAAPVAVVDGGLTVQVGPYSVQSIRIR